MTVPEIPTGTWKLDPSHSEVGFSVRHLMVSKVKGKFGTFDGTITIAPDPLQSSVNAEIDATSITTGDDQRDAHLSSADFFDTATHPTWTFASTNVKDDGGDFVVSGDLTIKGTTRVVDLELELNGIAKDPWGGTRVGFSAETEISRKDYGVDIEMPLDGGGVVVGDKVKISLEIEAVLQADEA